MILYYTLLEQYMDKFDETLTTGENSLNVTSLSGLSLRDTPYDLKMVQNKLWALD